METVLRLWTLHPVHLDAKGLVALWREGLLAQAVLLGKTRGYRHHPQLTRFRAMRRPVAAVATYLHAVQKEATRRGYRFDASRLAKPRTRVKIPATHGQLLYEWQHLKAKLQRRSPGDYDKVRDLKAPDPHPLFVMAPGPVEDWECIDNQSNS